VPGIRAGLHGSDRVPGAILEADAPNDNAAFSLEFHRGHRIAPWRSPYLLWRMETYTGVKMTQIGFWNSGIFVDRTRQPVALPEVDWRNGSLRPSRSEEP